LSSSSSLLSSLTSPIVPTGRPSNAN
jgi:hypothetical protein